LVDANRLGYKNLWKELYEQIIFVPDATYQFKTWPESVENSAA
jgi:hypothetical protein